MVWVAAVRIQETPAGRTAGKSLKVMQRSATKNAGAGCGSLCLEMMVSTTGVWMATVVKMLVDGEIALVSNEQVPPRQRRPWLTASRFRVVYVAS